MGLHEPLNIRDVDKGDLFLLSPTFPPNSSHQFQRLSVFLGGEPRSSDRLVGKLCGQAPLKSPLFSTTPPPPICVQVANRAEFLGSGLLQHDCKVGTEQFIGVFAQNRPEVSISLTGFRGISRLGLGSLTTPPPW